jgi:hypothetical protein
MKFDSKKTKEEVQTSKTINLSIAKVEKESVIVLIDGWRMRVYFDKDFKEFDKLGNGQEIFVNYFGEISDPHSIKLLPLKSL